MYFLPTILSLLPSYINLYILGIRNILFQSVPVFKFSYGVLCHIEVQFVSPISCISYSVPILRNTSYCHVSFFSKNLIIFLVLGLISGPHACWAYDLPLHYTQPKTLLWYLLSYSSDFWRGRQCEVWIKFVFLQTESELFAILFVD